MSQVRFRWSSDLFRDVTENRQANISQPSSGPTLKGFSERLFTASTLHRFSSLGNSFNANVHQPMESENTSSAIGSIVYTSQSLSICFTIPFAHLGVTHSYGTGPPFSSGPPSSPTRSHQPAPCNAAATSPRPNSHRPLLVSDRLHTGQPQGPTGHPGQTPACLRMFLLGAGIILRLQGCNKTGHPRK